MTMRCARLVAAMLTIVAVLVPARADAQCGSNASSCVSCHEAQQAAPVLSDGHPWHADHGFGDLCVACHGGDPAAASKDAAHGALPGACGGCHAEDADERAARYRVQVATSASSVAASAAAPPPMPPPPPSTGAAPGASSPVDRVLLAVIGVLSALLVLVV